MPAGLVKRRKYLICSILGWNTSSQGKWIVENLGPTLEIEGYSYLKLMILDDQRPLIPKWPREILEYDHGKGTV